MRKIIRNLIRRFVPQTDREAGFTLLELIVAMAAFTIICAGLTTLLITALRIEKYTADNTQCRETVRMLRAYVKDQAGSGIINTYKDDEIKSLDSLNDIEGFDGVLLTCKDKPILTYRHDKQAFYAGSYVEDSPVAAPEAVVKNIKNADFQLSGKVLTIDLEFVNNSFDQQRFSIYCPLN